METILIDPEFFGAGHSGPYIEAKVLATFRDSEGTLWVAFELTETDGVYVISTASRFFNGVDR